MDYSGESQIFRKLKDSNIHSNTDISRLKG
jgi:hypothetical protein